MTLYHCTSWGVYSSLKPSVPENQYTISGIVENVTPRISVAPTFFQCMLSPIMNNIEKKTQINGVIRSYPNYDVAVLNEKKYFEAFNIKSYILVYEINIQEYDSAIYRPTTDEVFDVMVSDEIWIKRELIFPEIKLYCIVRKAYPIFIEPISILKLTKKAKTALGPSEMMCPNAALFSIDELPEQNSFSEYKSLLKEIYDKEIQNGFSLLYN